MAAQHGPQRHHRRTIRLPNYDYTQAGAYFATVCTHDRVCWLGTIIEGEMRLSEAGRAALVEWEQLPHRFPGATVDSMVIMPNHVHALVVIDDGASVPALGAMIRAIKGATARSIRLGGSPTFRWQRNYYEHVVRTEQELAAIRDYITQNPRRWIEDSLYPRDLEN